MNKLLLVFMTVMVFTLSACTEEPIEVIEFEYADFGNHAITSYAQAENQQGEIYFVYYYSESCSHCELVKQDILGFLATYEGLPYYIFNVMVASDTSRFEEFVGTPTIFVLSDGVIIESYVGSDEILEFIVDYSQVD